MAASGRGRSVPPRARWAVERLGLVGDERVLEVGCGAGAAAELVCARISSGTMLAIDRSTTMARRTEERNRADVEAGRLAVRAEALVDLEPGAGPFTVVFAVDVNVFGGACAGELDRVCELLDPGGSLHLVHRPPDPAKVEAFAANLERRLPGHGFTVEDVTVAELDEGRVLGVHARRR